MQSDKGIVLAQAMVTYLREHRILLPSLGVINSGHRESANQTGPVGLEMHIDQCSTGAGALPHKCASGFVCKSKAITEI